METPTNSRFRASVRNPTPRLSERKKSLFSSKEEAQEDLMNDIKPLESKSPRYTRSRSRASKSRRCIGSSLTGSGDQSKRDSDDNSPVSLSPCGEGHKIISFSIRKSPRHKKTPTKINHKPIEKAENCKENEHIGIEPDEQLQLLFNSSMMLNGKDEDIEINVTSEKSCPSDDVVRDSTKRKLDTLQRSPDCSPKQKISKYVTKPVFPLSSISTKSFYSITKPSHATKLPSPTLKLPNISPKSKKQNRRSICSINKGVRHKIRRLKHSGSSHRAALTSIDVDHILSNVRNEKLRNLISAKRKEKIQIESVHKLFKTGQNPIEMARPLNSMNLNANAYANNNNNNVEKDSKTRRHTYSGMDEFDFSDIECESADENCSEEEFEVEEVIPRITPTSQVTQSPLKSADCAASNKTNRKFFKSDRSRSSRKEVKITENITASVCNGKISLVEHKKNTRKKIKLKNTPVNEFSAEQATVDAILKNLDDTTFGDTTSYIDTESVCTTEDAALIDDASTHDLQLSDDTDYSIFRNRLPYNTTDPELTEQQHLLLDFLINNSICTEENFTIFIADPDNHKEEASRIVDQVIVVVNEESNFRERIPYHTNDPAVIKRQTQHLDFLLEHNICTEENFDIFIANYENRFAEAQQIVGNILSQDTDETVDNASSVSTTFSHLDTDYALNENEMEVEIGNQNLIGSDKIASAETIIADESSTTKSGNLYPIFYAGKCQPLALKSSRKPLRNWQGGHGVNQLQIDAGQKNFGAQQCKQCGLVYTVHEPEEEKLHRDYHSSLYVLRFKGWIDEDIVAIYPEWGQDGRILRISENSHIKRKERLMDVLKIVDKELGFSSYIFPKSYVAYFAVRKFQIVGLCLVQPLQKANKYICINGVDCCTEEEFNAKCGVSRIWVSPLHRRLHIASKLIQAVQFNTIFGEEISVDKIAFSAPTENGKQLARKVTKMENFLVYQ